MARPAKRMKAGTRTPRTNVASMRTASAIPTPNNLIKLTCEVATAIKTIDINAAAAVTIRPVRSRPVATAAVLAATERSEWSHSSLMRESRNTS